MQWFYNLKISIKLISSFILIALVAGIVGYIGITEIKTTDRNFIELFNLFGKPLTNIGNAAKSFQKSRAIVKDVILDRGSNNRGEYVTQIAELDKDIDANLAVFNKSIRTKNGRVMFQNLQSDMHSYRIIREKVIKLALDNKEDKALLLMRQEGQKIAQAADQLFEELLKQKVSVGDERSKQYAAAADDAVRTMVLVIIIGMALAVILGVFISRIIGNPVRKLVEAANKLSLGDIKVSVEATTKDEVGILMEAFKKMIENISEQAYVAERIAAGDLTVQVTVKSDKDILGKNLKEMVEKNNLVLGDINNAAEQVASGAKQVSASSQALSQGSTEQAASIEEVTASIEQIATQTKQNAVNANQANDLAVAAKGNAMQGNAQMKEMLGAMNEINDSSANISKIIKVIDEIAFQTNILALNAAVEAARAGQHGKGFAVVAEEVRNLAARSANAAKETTSMIEGSIKKVEFGTKIANETAQALDKIVDGVTKATTLVGEIATASNEQATGIAQVNQAIMQVSQVTQMNTATAEESAAASEELSAQALLLKDAVSRFKLRKQGREDVTLANLTPETIRMIQEMMKREDGISKSQDSVKQVAPTVQKNKISLDDKEFGKY